jgi:hypothetical protein
VVWPDKFKLDVYQRVLRRDHQPRRIPPALRRCRSGHAWRSACDGQLVSHGPQRRSADLAHESSSRICDFMEGLVPSVRRTSCPRTSAPPPRMILRRCVSTRARRFINTSSALAR